MFMKNLSQFFTELNSYLSSKIHTFPAKLKKNLHDCVEFKISRYFTRL